MTTIDPFENYNSLTPKMKRFVNAYIKFKQHRKKAALEAGAAEKSASVSATRWMKKEVVWKAIDERSRFYFEELNSGALQTLQEICDIAHFDIRKIFDEDGLLKQIKDLDSNTAAAIASVKVHEIFVDGENTTCQVKEIKTVPKIPALEMKAKIQKLLDGESQRKGDIIIIGAPAATEQQNKATDERGE